MKRITFIILILFLFSGAEAQERKVQNRPYLDQRVFHYGFLFGMQMQDMELNNVGPQTIQNEDGTQSTKNIVCDVDNWNPGFTVGPNHRSKATTFQFCKKFFKRVY